MNYFAKQLSRGAAPSIRRDELSQSPVAKYERDRRLLNDDAANRDAMMNAKRRNRKRAAALVGSIGKLPIMHPSQTAKFLNRIRHHLSRGRSAADIAVREGWMVSQVIAGIEAVKQSPPS